MGWEDAHNWQFQAHMLYSCVSACILYVFRRIYMDAPLRAHCTRVQPARSLSIEVSFVRSNMQPAIVMCRVICAFV